MLYGISDDPNHEHDAFSEAKARSFVLQRPQATMDIDVNAELAQISLGL